MTKNASNVCSLLLGVSAIPTAAFAQAQPASNTIGVGEIVVTAQKRSESINDVGMTIAAFRGEELTEKGITGPDQLIKVVPGFTFTESARGAPIYAIRGVGFDDSTLGSSSTVALYVDEVPLSFPTEARFATLDLERVEVLKGPQGILFGQNSTAGAINFIAAKPTDEIAAGFDASYGRFNTLDFRGFLSAPVTENLGVRISAMGIHSDGWQKSYTRDDSLGAKRQFAARALVQWEPSDSLKVLLSVNGWSDKSDTQAAQLLEVVPLIAAAVDPEYDAYPRSPRNARAADWDAGRSWKRDDNFLQASARIDLDINPALKLTSISAYSRYNQKYSQDIDGSALNVYSFDPNDGRVRSFNQELRLAYSSESINALVGVNYSRDKTYDETTYGGVRNSAHNALFNINTTVSFADQKIRTMAAFANIDYKTGPFTFHAGARYTKDKRNFEGCIRDGGNGTAATAFNFILGIADTPLAIQPGECFTSNNRVPGLVKDKLNEDNVSWRVGIDFAPSNNALLYANIAKGYKSGSFPNVNSADASQVLPARQESVLAYEGGFKLGALNRALQINGAAFYYDYGDKQLRGRRPDVLGIFGILEFLLNVPKSRAYGAELQIQAAPFEGLTLNLAGTYVNTKVRSNFVAVDPVGNTLNYRGLPFPQTPKWNVTGGANYERPISSNLKAFTGADFVYHSKATALFSRADMVGLLQPSPVLRPNDFFDPNSFKIKAFTTVDARIGIGDQDNKWRAWIWGKNIFNTYYWSNSTTNLEAIYRLTAMPATYGGSVSFRF